MDLSGYRFEPLREGAELALFRGQHNVTGASILLLAPASRRDEMAPLARLEHEYALSEHLDPNWAAKPLALVRHEGRTVLALSDPGGQPLNRLLGKPLELSHFLNVATGIASVLRHVHAAGLVHKDIKPANILVDEAGHVRLTGFGFATRTPRERQAPLAPEVIAGTLAYMAPEQTGRTNRSIDHRCDLYSLGVTLYEMLVGALPFTASKSMDWIYCHVARVAPPPSVRVDGSPAVVDAMILKLLSKNAEDRYQTAAGIEFDLQRCLSEFRTDRPIGFFPIAARDLTDRLRIPETTYGREREIQAMRTAFERVATLGRLEFLLITGPAGIGKSALVHELHGALHSTRHLFTTGRFDRDKRHVPYAALTEAFQTLVRQLLSQNEPDLNRWRSSLQIAVGPNSQLMVDLLPDLALILDVPPKLLNVTPQEAKNRFHFVFRRFVEVFARAEHPLVLFLDDLQWIDDATLELLNALMTDEDIPYLLLIGAYRICEHDSSPNITRIPTLMGVRESRVQTIPLTALTFSDTERLIASTLQALPETVRPLAEVVFHKTQGNPFFTAQFLTGLNIDRLLTLNTDAARWQWDLVQIKTRGVTDNVAELLAARLGRYPDMALRAIQQLACLTQDASSTTLGQLLATTEGEIEAIFREFVESGLLNQKGRGYAFAHAGVRDAAYGLIPENDRAKAHLTIARVISVGVDPATVAENIFEIAEQFNRGAALIISAAERQRVAELNLAAGKRAEAAAAYGSALSYFTVGCDFLSPDSWVEHYQTTFDLELHRAECQFMAGNLAFAEKHLAMLSERSASLLDRALIVHKQSIVSIYQGRHDHAIDLAVDCLARMNIVLPRHPTEEDIAHEYRELLDRIGARPIESLSEIPAMVDRHWFEVMGVLEELLLPSGSAFNPDLQHLAVIRMVNISVVHGNCHESAHAYADLGGLILGWRVGTFDDGLKFGRVALSILASGFDRYAARIYSVISGTVGLWTAPLKECHAMAVRATETDRQQGGIAYSGYAWATGLSALLGSGQTLAEVHRFADQGLAFSRKSKFSLLIECINASLFLIRALRGATSAFATFSDADLDEVAHERYLESVPHLWHGLARFRIRQLQLRYYAGNYEACLVLIAKLEPDIGPIRVFEITEYRFFSALAQAAVLDNASIQGAPHHDALKANYEHLREWARRYPASFLHRADLVGAEIARLGDHAVLAETLYESSIQSAHQQGFLQDEALAFELGSRFYRSRGFSLIAETYLRNARSCYLRWGADGKVRQLDEQFAELGESMIERGAAPVPGRPLFGNLDLDAVVEMSQAVSGEIVLERLIDRLMVTVVEHAGAVRGVLLLPRETQSPIVAEAIADDAAVQVTLRHQAYDAIALPLSILNFVTRTHEAVIIGDAWESHAYSADPYIRDRRPRSVLCLPLTKQRRLVGLLYLENSLSSHIFTQNRLSVLQLLASQAAISIENAELFAAIQKTEEHSRRVSEELKRSFDMIPALAWRASRSGSMEIANKQWHDYTGVSEDEAHTGTWIRSFHPNDIDKVRNKWRDLSEFQTSGAFEARMQRYDGEFRSFLVRVTPTHDEGGAIVNWHGTHTDIHDLKHTQDSLRKSEADLAEGQRISHTGSWVWNGETNVITWSEECARIFGFDPTQRAVSYESLRERIYPEDRLLVDAQHKAAMLAEGDYTFEHRILSPDGAIRTVLSRGRLVKTERDQCVEYVGTIMDITEQKKSEARMREAHAALSRVSRLTALGELTASIAHEVNQPLMAIVTNAATCLQWLTDEQLNIQEARLASKRIIRDGKRAGDVISSIRGMARKSPPQMTKMDLNASILEVLSLTRNELDRHGIMATTDLGEDAGAVLADRVQIQQVALNLIMNGIDAINAKQAQPRTITIRSQRGDPGYILVSISDTGVGVDHLGSEKIFEAFFSTKPEGIGIGLSICRSIVEAHHGRLWTSANQPNGSIFHFTVPMYTEELALL